MTTAFPKEEPKVCPICQNNSCVLNDEQFRNKHMTHAENEIYDSLVSSLHLFVETRRTEFFKEHRLVSYPIERMRESTHGGS